MHHHMPSSWSPPNTYNRIKKNVKPSRIIFADLKRVRTSPACCGSSCPDCHSNTPIRSTFFRKRSIPDDSFAKSFRRPWMFSTLWDCLDRRDEDACSAVLSGKRKSVAWNLDFMSQPNAFNGENWHSKEKVCECCTGIKYMKSWRD